MPEGIYTIGKLAAASGVHVETVRYYQRLGLVPTPRRAYGSARRYGNADLKRIRFIKRSQWLGYSLDEVALLLKLSVGEHCAETKVLADRKLQVVNAKLRDLTAMKNALEQLARACAARKGGFGCPIIDNLSGDAPDERDTRNIRRRVSKST